MLEEQLSSRRTRLGDGDGSFGLVLAILLCILDLLDNVIIALHNLTEDDVLAVKPVGEVGGDEELGAWQKASTCQ